MHIIPNVGGGNMYLLTKLKNLDSQLPICCFLLSSPFLLVCLSLFSATNFSFSPDSLTFPSSKYYTNTLCICHHRAGFVSGIVSFSPFFICRLFVRLGHLWNRGSIFHACLLSTKSNYKKKKPSFLLPAHSAAPCDVEIITPSPEAFLVHA